MIYFVSDTHLGSKAIPNFKEHQAKFCALLDEMSKDATQIYLLGDIFDYWYEYFWSDSSKTQYAPTLDMLKALSQKGIAVHFFIGNHDLWTFGYLSSYCGIKIHTKPLRTILAGQQVYLSHGDWETALLVPKFRHLRKFFHNPLAQFLFRCVPPFLGNALGYTWAKHSREKEFVNPHPYRGENEEELVLFAKQKEPDTLYIFGHRHIELDLLLTHGSRVVILGDTFQKWTYGQMDESGNFILKTLE